MSTQSSSHKKPTSTARNKKVVAGSGVRKTSEGVAVDHFSQARIKEVKEDSSVSKLFLVVYNYSRGPARGVSQVACRNFKMSRVGVLSRLHNAVGNLASYICLRQSFVAISFERCRYFLAHVACRNLPWQGLILDLHCKDCVNKQARTVQYSSLQSFE